MCGIIGYSGNDNAVDILVSGLQALEYRGYDSAGIAVFNDNGIKVVKSMGKLKFMKQKIETLGDSFSSNCGIGHTRWATHGKPSDVNSHPHSTENLSLVHNGIIENYYEIKKDLIENHGYIFESETDTEACAKLIDLYYKENHDPILSILTALKIIRGSYAFGIIFKDKPNHIYATRKDSPLICAEDSTGYYIASDIPAVLKRTNKYYSLDEGDVAEITDNSIRFFDCDKNEIKKEIKTASWDIEAAEKGNYPHFMLKEIMEQPSVIEKTVKQRITDGIPDLHVEGLDDEKLKSFERIIFVACGTAMHAGMVGKFVIEKLARIPVNVEIASEFRYMNPILTKKDLVIVISQSGETADSLAALRLAKERGCKTFGIVNVIGSSIARESDYVLYTAAGPEIAVASTKAYSVQISIMYLLGIKLGYLHKKLSVEETKEYVRELISQMPFFVGGVISESEKIRYIAECYKDARDLFFIGRGIDYSLSLEGSLKLKEISYIHSEAYAAGELKHGTISLITDSTPVIAVATNDELYEKMLSNIKEVKARGAKIIMICKYGAKGAEEVADKVIYIPHCSEIFTPMTAVPILQLFAYHVSVLRGCDVDKPRNLAKSVTVE